MMEKTKKEFGKKRKARSTPVEPGECKKRKITVTNSSVKTSALPLPEQPSTLSKKKEKRKLFKKELRKKLTKEGKLSWKKKKNMEKKSYSKSVVVAPIAPPKSLSEISANWKALQAVLKKQETKSKKKRVPRQAIEKNSTDDKKSVEEEKTEKPKIWFEIDDENLLEVKEEKLEKPSIPDPDFDPQRSVGGLTKLVGLDCEMVGVGEDGQDSILARVSIVNQHGTPVYDKYVKPTETVTDYRTAFSGIRPHNLGDGALPYLQVQNEVADILKGRILVGHALSNDLQVLFLSHPFRRTRDTQKYKPFKKGCGGMPSLKKLADKFLHVSVQTGEHSSVEDAQIAMRLFMMHRIDWEKELNAKRKGKAGKPKAD